MAMASRVLGPAIREKAGQYFNQPVETALKKYGVSGTALGKAYEYGKSVKDYKDIYNKGNEYLSNNPGSYERISKNIDSFKKFNYGGKKYSKKSKYNKKGRKNRRTRRNKH